MNTIEILQKFGLKSKVLFIFRHGFKTTDNHITPECLAEIEAEGIKGAEININAIHEGSHFIRTAETVAALEKWLVANGATIEKHFPKDDRLGDEKLFSFYTSEIREKMKKFNLTAYEVTEKYGTNFLLDWESDLMIMISDLLETLNFGDVCAVPCHTPTVEVIFNLFADSDFRDPKMAIKELEGIFLVQESNGFIHTIR
ncbi:MAG: hypothetical protein WC523_03345 [Patescibacteria group bacterium]